MIYTNTDLKVVSRQTRFGTVTGVAIGEAGRGRREVFLPTPGLIQAGYIIEGLRPDLTIGTSRSGKLRIHASKDDGIYLILSSEKGYTRRGSGYIKAPKGQDFELINRANGADGAAGRVGTWDAVIVKAKDGNVFRVTWGGSRYGYHATFYVVSGGKVYSADQPEVEDLYKNLGLKIPFSLSYDQDEERLVITPDEWVTI